MLTAVVKGWVVLTWPHFRNAPTFFIVPENNCSRAAGERLLLRRLRRRHSLVAVISDKPVAAGASRSLLAGTLFATLLAPYWIVDEIYPFVN